MSSYPTDSSPLTEAEIDEASHYSIAIRWAPDDQIFIAEIPELPGARTHGSTPAEAAQNAVEVGALWIRANRLWNRPIPEPKVLLTA